MIDPAEIAGALINARIEHSILDDFPGGDFPANTAEAHAVLNEIIAQFQLPIGGWKAAFTNEAGQKAMGVDGPACGPLFAPYIVPSPANLNLPAESWRGLECEFGFRMSGNLPAREALYTLEEVAAATGSLYPAIEVVDSRVATGAQNGGVAVIADHCGNAAFVYGAEVQDWRGVDLAAATVDLKVNGEIVVSGSGEAVMGNPLNSLVWIANYRSRLGDGLKSGDWITTGSTMGIFKAPPGSTVVADFGALGTVELVFAT
jgi:2-keto-4-pentenoate hydratase